MHHCFLLLGSNQGNRIENLSRAEQEIHHKIGRIQLASSVYQTAPWGFKTALDFLNQVLIVETEMTAGDVLEKILEIETELGRVRNSKGYASRMIDIDILFYDEEIIDDPQLQIPHPRLHERMFTLVPLMEIDSDKIHPKLEKTIKQLTKECTDKLEVKIFLQKPKSSLTKTNEPK